jgi:hypothetical protein
MNDFSRGVNQATAATVEHVQQLQAQLIGLAEDLRTAQRTASEYNALFTPGTYRLVPTLTSVTAVCTHCPDDDVVAFMDSSYERPDLATLVTRVREHHHRFHQEQT